MSERLQFGKIPPEEVAFRRRSKAQKQVRERRKSPIPQDIYEVYKALPSIDKIIQEDWVGWREARKERRERQLEILQSIWGTGVELPRYVPPSIASSCLRWVGYEQLEEVLGIAPIPPTVEGSLVMMMGSAGHWSLLRKIEQQLPGLEETSFIIDEADLSGRVDYLFKNPATQEYQLWEFKFVHDYVFRKVRRKNLENKLRRTPDVYAPTPEYRKQVLLYMWAKRQEGKNVVCGNIIYINRNDGKRKEALVLWDAIAEYDAEQLVEQIKKAKQNINEGKLPEPTVESTHVCAKFCPYRGHCDYGQKFAAGQVRKERKKRPTGVYKKIKKDIEAKRQRMIELGLVQGQLPGLEKD